MGRLIEFPPVVEPIEAGELLNPEQVIIDLAPTIQTEADLQHMLSHVDADKRDAVEKCLRAHGACKEPEHPAC